MSVCLGSSSCVCSLSESSEHRSWESSSKRLREASSCSPPLFFILFNAFFFAFLSALSCVLIAFLSFSLFSFSCLCLSFFSSSSTLFLSAAASLSLVSSSFNNLLVLPQLLPPPFSAWLGRQTSLQEHLQQLHPGSRHPLVQELVGPVHSPLPSGPP